MSATSTATSCPFGCLSMQNELLMFKELSINYFNQIMLKFNHQDIMITDLVRKLDQCLNINYQNGNTSGRKKVSSDNSVGCKFATASTNVSKRPKAKVVSSIPQAQPEVDSECFNHQVPVKQEGNNMIPNAGVGVSAAIEMMNDDVVDELVESHRFEEIPTEHAGSKIITYCRDRNEYCYEWQHQRTTSMKATWTCLACKKAGAYVCLFTSPVSSSRVLRSDPEKPKNPHVCEPVYEFDSLYRSFGAAARNQPRKNGGKCMKPPTTDAVIDSIDHDKVEASCSTPSAPNEAIQSPIKDTSPIAVGDPGSLSGITTMTATQIRNRFSTTIKNLDGTDSVKCNLCGMVFPWSRSKSAADIASHIRGVHLNRKRMWEGI